MYQVKADIPDDAAARLFASIGLHEEPGWTGWFTRQDAPSAAFAVGTRIAKQNSEPGDAHADGSLGTVLGSMSHPNMMGGEPCYFVEWDAHPRQAVGTMAFKIRLA